MKNVESAFEVRVRVVPRAKRDEVGGERAGRLLVRTTAPPVDDKANHAVCKVVATFLRVPARNVEIVAGHHSRDKTLHVLRVLDARATSARTETPARGKQTDPLRSGTRKVGAGAMNSDRADGPSNRQGRSRTS